MFRAITGLHLHYDLGHIDLGIFSDDWAGHPGSYAGSVMAGHISDMGLDLGVSRPWVGCDSSVAALGRL